jgi:hypothetical protein
LSSPSSVAFALWRHPVGGPRSSWLCVLALVPNGQRLWVFGPGGKRWARARAEVDPSSVLVTSVTGAGGELDTSARV